MIAIAATVLILAVHGLMFIVMWLFSLFLPGKRSGTPGQSPFASRSAQEN
ncbi:MAG TPA: hypothetical protein VHC22_18280 [Pirellulales bacterium]|nr:hypothetical protein [Pirellulales bacterium]